MDFGQPRSPIGGFHHVTAIAGDPERNIAFYTGVLGLNLVKVTVDYEDPTIYHLYYGAGSGAPGTVITFFIYPDGKPGRRGAGVVDAVAFAIPAHSLGAWIDRFITGRIPFEGPFRRNGRQTLALRDPDGLQLELIALPMPSLSHDETGIQRLHAVTIWEAESAATSDFLTKTLGFRAIGQQDGIESFTSAGDALLHVRTVAGFWSGVVGCGSVHHVAWQVADDADLAAWQIEIGFAQATVSPIRNRFYFQSIYVPEPGGVLFELATPGAGFTLDEPADRLGRSLMLPPWFESQRAAIERGLPRIALPTGEIVPSLPLSDAATSADTLATGPTDSTSHQGERGMTTESARDPHAGQRVLLAGEPLEHATSAVILLHGRGARADDILSLAGTLNTPGFTFLAPQAAGNTWYPHSFLFPIEENEPNLSSALGAVHSVLNIANESGIPSSRVIVLGFSQGACLALEYAARHARRFGGIIAFTGGLIGPEGTPRTYPGSLAGTPVYIGGSDIDPHVPLARLEESANVLTALGAEVTLRIFPGMGHTINSEELDTAKAMLAALGPA